MKTSVDDIETSPKMDALPDAGVADTPQTRPTRTGERFRAAYENRSEARIRSMQSRRKAAPRRLDHALLHIRVGASERSRDAAWRLARVPRGGKCDRGRQKSGETRSTIRIVDAGDD